VARAPPRKRGCRSCAGATQRATVSGRDELEPGESIAADSAIPHRFATIGGQPVVVVWADLGRAGDPRGELAP